MPYVDKQQSWKAFVFRVKTEYGIRGGFHLNRTSDELSDLPVAVDICKQVDAVVTLGTGDFEFVTLQLRCEPISAGEFDELTVLVPHFA